MGTPEQEDIIRESLEKQFGVEFLSPNEVEKEVKKAVKSPAVEYQISVGEIIQKCEDAADKMGTSNPHKYLFFLCKNAMNQLVHRLSETERKLAEAEAKLNG